MRDDEYVQGFDAVAVQQACKDTINEHQIPDGLALLICVPRPMTIPAK